MATTLDVNGRAVQVQAAPDTPLLWVLRDELGLTGTKYGCGVAQCGACTVLADGQPVRSCSAPISAFTGAKITTIESLGGQHPLQQAWVRHDVPQCGYCQSGQIMSAVALLTATPQPSDDDIDAAMDGNICRCGTYQRIRAAIKDAAGMGRPAPPPVAVTPAPLAVPPPKA
ncbi:(2Fe-2S)-binding protein [Phenylobacterium sp.]|uniref:(2Fe-2S)-binding protein n=1 Tax=Phenylobacterium sp. TaxID=1871053 RepID=UPI002C3FD6C0|nr:(2Fe-2S)-binding protein [Phenylobacterium sp.]HVI31205.1 (2Fe-2S)-binding protein [Phenylobacterium sp.]